jgi:hypothetical protein
MQVRRSWVAALVVVSAALSAAVGLADASDDGWKVVETDRGITMSRREQPGLHLPAFRGHGRVQGDVVQVFASMLDVRSVPDWAYGTDRARLISRLDADSDVIYLYSDIPWPVRDRDMVVRRDIEVVKPGQEYRIHLKCESQREAEHDGVIRVKNCESCFRLRRVDARTTEIDYAMSLDPAGHLPAWVAGWVAKTVPFKTLVAIEERAAKTKGQLEALVRRWSAPL